MILSQFYRKSINVLASMAFILVFMCVLCFSSAVMEGVGKGISVCVETILPSLFIFMVLTSFLTDSQVSYSISRPLRPITRYLLKLPDALGCTVLMSMVGGYPVGAKMISQLYRNRSISRQQAAHMLCFCCNPSPAFVITAVGAGMIGNVKAGAVIYGASILSSLLIGAALGRKSALPDKKDSLKKQSSFSSRVIFAVNNALSATVVMCGFVLFFSAVVEVVVLVSDRIGLWRLLPFAQAAKIGLYGLMEVTLGCIECVDAPLELQAVALPFLISFSGISVIFQVMAMFGSDTEVSFRPFLLSRVSHGILTALISYPFLIKMLLLSPVYKLENSPVPGGNANTLPLTILLACMCCLLFLKAARLQINREKM